MKNGFRDGKKNELLQFTKPQSSNE